MFLSWTVLAVEPAFECRVAATDVASGLRAGSGNTVVALRPDGTPVVAYFDLPPPGDPQLYPPEAALYLRLCDDAECTTGTTHTVETAVAAHSVDLSLLLRPSDGAPILSYYSRNPASPGVRIFICADAECTNHTIRRQTTVLNYGVTTDVSLSPGDRPFVVFGDRRPPGPDDLARCRCTNAPCDASICGALPGSGRSALYPSTLWRADDTALISHIGSGAHVYQCANSDCSSGLDHLVYPTPIDAIGFSYSALARRTSGIPLAVYGLFYSPPPPATDYGLPILIDCADANCTSGTPRVLDTTQRDLRLLRMAIRPNGRGVITWGEDGTTTSLYLYQCADRNCRGGRVATIIPDAEGGHGLATRSDGVAVLALRPSGSGKVKLAFCGLPDDLIFTDDYEMP